MISLNATSQENDVYYYEDEDAIQVEDIVEFIRPKSWTWFFIAANICVFVTGLTGNLLVCLAIYRNRGMRTVTNFFLTNLAIADFMVILICLPPTVLWDVTSTWFFGNVACKVVLYLQTVSVTVSVLTLTFISIDRWYAICFPLKFISSTGRAKTVIALIWIAALLFDVPELIVYNTKEQDNFPLKTHLLTQCIPCWSQKANHVWTLIKMLGLYLVPLLVMACTYCNIVYVLWKPKGNQHELEVEDDAQIYTFSFTSNRSTRGQVRARKTAAKMLISVVVMFAICYFPVHLHNILRIAIGLKNSIGNRIFSCISHWLCYANSAVNPLIYNFMSGKFRKEFKRSYECCCKKEKRENRHERIQRFQISSSIKSRSSSRQSGQRTSSDLKRSDTVVSKLTD